jgi:hypothetical protein
MCIIFSKQIHCCRWFTHFWAWWTFSTLNVTLCLFSDFSMPVLTNTTHFRNRLHDLLIILYIPFLPLLSSQLWNTKLQTDKSKFVCWLERVVWGRGFWWPHSGLIKITVSNFPYLLVAQFKSLLLTVTLTRESKLLFNIKCKWCSI